MLMFMWHDLRPATPPWDTLLKKPRRLFKIRGETEYPWSMMLVKH